MLSDNIKLSSDNNIKLLSDNLMSETINSF